MKKTYIKTCTRVYLISVFPEYNFMELNFRLSQMKLYTLSLIKKIINDGRKFTVYLHLSLYLYIGNENKRLLFVTY